ncbi:MAG: DinB family protein [Gemmatimonadota bacterium]|uniref:DinB family protein n=1 Tax=Candidatus Palauibacter scopulicola TaxID=3056741 RepID=UPI0023970471|nr:DinB family protein [Candidatus Palauibacter scopulicola]MDE2661769.1 DinB family protein [Candidatus Palauibacter scopulicola]
MKRPRPDEHGDYYAIYIDRVPDDRTLADVLGEAPDALDALLGDLPPGRENFAYEPGKWTCREVLGHVIDAERLFAYRVLHIARADSAELPGMDQDEWAEASNAADRPIRELLHEFRALRTANAALFGSLDEDALSRRGVASGAECTVRALIHIIAGHELHHRDVLRERYL